jgi:endoglucanase
MHIAWIAIGALALCGQPQNDKPRLTVEGNRLLWGGAPVQLKGVAVGDPVTARADRPIDDYKVLAVDWKAKAVRLSIHPFVWKHRPQLEVLSKLDRDVRAARDAGLIVLIDWHTIGWPDAGYQIPNWPGGDRDTYDSSMALARDFWSTVARKYANDGGIAFELWNEPASFDSNGKVIKDPGWAQLRPHLQELVDLIRKDSNNLIIGAGTHWTYDLRGIKDAPLEGENIAYAWHIYAGNDRNDPTKWAEHLDGLDQAAPVIVTEWGFQRGTDAHFKGSPEDFGNAFVKDFLNGRELSWTAWVWHPTWGPPMLESDWRTPNEFGQFVKQQLATE